MTIDNPADEIFAYNGDAGGSAMAGAGDRVVAAKHRGLRRRRARQRQHHGEGQIWQHCRPACGAPSSSCKARPVPIIQCSAPPKRRPSGSVRAHRVVKRAAARAGLPPPSQPIGCATPTPRTPSITAPPSTSSRPPSAVPPSPPPADTSTSDPTTARHDTCSSELARAVGRCRGSAPCPLLTDQCPGAAPPQRHPF